MRLSQRIVIVTFHVTSKAEAHGRIATRSRNPPGACEQRNENHGREEQTDANDGLDHDVSFAAQADGEAFSHCCPGDGEGGEQDQRVADVQEQLRVLGFG